MQNPEVGDLVLINWIDIHTDTGWSDISGDPGVAPCKSVGFVTHVTENHVSLAASMGIDSIKNHTNTETNLRQGIPLGCITSWVRLIPRRAAK